MVLEKIIVYMHFGMSGQIVVDDFSALKTYRRTNQEGADEDVSLNRFFVTVQFCIMSC